MCLHTRLHPAQKAAWEAADHEEKYIICQNNKEWIEPLEDDREAQITSLNSRGICSCVLGKCSFHPVDDYKPIGIIELKRSTRDHVMEGDW